MQGRLPGSIIVDFGLVYFKDYVLTIYPLSPDPIDPVTYLRKIGRASCRERV